MCPSPTTDRERELAGMGEGSVAGCAMTTILLTGATGFIGSHVAIALATAGYEVRCATRSVERARASDPGQRWVEVDLERPATLPAALEGCAGAIYLVHGMGTGRDDYPEHERVAAETFASAAATAKLSRIVYLGGVLPRRGASRHLRSRARTGAILRAGAVDTIELRAAMVVGAGSASWGMVRDLARRLPAMVLPRWLRNVSYPIAVEDVVKGLIAALELPGTGSRLYDLPGPERITHREMLVRAARAMGHKRTMLSVPLVTPRLSSYWIALVTRTSLAMAQELVEGVRFDLEPTNESLWERTGLRPMSLDQAIHRALRDDAITEIPSDSMRRRLETVGVEHPAPVLA
jgi:uncharacterized protein YbjT (DUF2867 family)